MKQSQLYIFAGVFVIVSIILAVITGSIISNSLEEENQILKTILKADADLAEISIDSQMADSYYDEAGFFYEVNDFLGVESNCRLARNYYLKESQGYKVIKSEMVDKNFNDELIDIYIGMLDSNIQIANNMFEACEYLESASRYYGMNNYDMGTAEIESMNVKIMAHDKAIEEYNQYLADFRVKLDKRIEE